MPPKKPTPPSTYLRLKHARTTILLLASPITPLSTLVADLLSALQERYPHGLPILTTTTRRDPVTSRAAGVSSTSDAEDEDEDGEGNDEMEVVVVETLTPLPESVEEIELAVPNDAYDPAAGWREIDWVEEGGEGMKGVGVAE
ncbi:hypothetical protein V499_03979, partial [Pseudogymnoascus sp. VKM F-103]